MPTLILRPCRGETDSGTDTGKDVFDGDSKTYDTVYTYATGTTSKTKTVTIRNSAVNRYYFDTLNVHADGVVDEVRLVCNALGRYNASSGYNYISCLRYLSLNIGDKSYRHSVPTTQKISSFTNPALKGKRLLQLLNELEMCRADTSITVPYKKTSTIRSVSASSYFYIYELSLEIDYHVPIKLTKNDNQVNTFSKTKVNNNWVDVIGGYTKKNGIWVPLTD